MDPIRKGTDTLTKDGDKAMERVNEVAESAWQKGRETFKELRGQGENALEQVQKSGQQVWDDAQKLLQKHPVKSVGLALIIGVAIGGALVAMRNKD